jgi:hypothetical protein
MTTYDYAYPIDWFRALDHDTQVALRGKVVWAYPAGFIFGLPAPLDDDAELALKNAGVEYYSYSAQERKEIRS